MSKRKIIHDEEAEEEGDTISVSSNDLSNGELSKDDNSENETSTVVITTPYARDSKKTKINHHNSSSTPSSSSSSLVLQSSGYKEKRTTPSSKSQTTINNNSKSSSVTKTKPSSSPSGSKSATSTPKTPTTHKNVTSNAASSTLSKATPSSSSHHHGKSSSSKDKTPKSASSFSTKHQSDLINLSPASIHSSDDEEFNENADNKLTIGEIITPPVVEFSKNKIHTYFPYKFSTIEDFEKVVKCIEEKYNELNIYVKAPDLKVIKDWQNHLKNQKLIIAARVVRKEKSRDDNTFNIEQEDKDFKTINRLMYRLRNILINHENHDTTDISRLTSCVKERTERKKQEEEEERILQKEHNELQSKSEADQKKFFIKREGPVQGLKEYYEWSSTLALGAHLSTIAHTHDRQFSVVDKLSPFVATARRNTTTTTDDDEDDILNQDIL
ncbi:hypothetical protein C9374_000720 [Naegleria lovaniensis]|uniref:Uncharacterized protein n=1 Tax=Naegleria lovaniensis TaxID=51637 RepID=A0AA88KPF3_NAELO|nr:uncharacterized protein C9374_000720 [Naegleria lovaniensis]KAG2388556.1 hypothetical protein C9374_000720 [Naegleria lovaniensis]